MYRPLCRGRYTSPKETFRMFFGLRFLEVTPHSPMVGSASYASRIAVTPCPPAAQTEIRPRTG